jgi:hypothetical protein
VGRDLLLVDQPIEVCRRAVGCPARFTLNARS